MFSKPRLMSSSDGTAGTSGASNGEKDENALLLPTSPGEEDCGMDDEDALFNASEGEEWFCWLYRPGARDGSTADSRNRVAR